MQTKDNYNDVIVALISSVVPALISQFQILLQPDNINHLKTASVIKVSRLATVEESKIAAVIGKLSPTQLATFKMLFKSLVD